MVSRVTDKVSKKLIVVTNSNKSAQSNLGEGRVAALSHTYAVKSPFVTMARPKFALKYPFSWTDPQTPLPASSLDLSDL